MCAKLLLLWQNEEWRMCKAFVIVENEECVQSFCNNCVQRLKSVCKAFVIVENEECVQSFCYCGE